MRFDASVPAQLAVSRSLTLDPRMIRHSIVKLASRLGNSGAGAGGDVIKGTESVEGKADWMPVQDWRETDAAAFMGQDRRARDVKRLKGLEEEEVRMQARRAEREKEGGREEMVEVL